MQIGINLTHLYEFKRTVHFFKPSNFLYHSLFLTNRKLTVDEMALINTDIAL